MWYIGLDETTLWFQSNPNVNFDVGTPRIKNPLQVSIFVQRNYVTSAMNAELQISVH